MKSTKCLLGLHELVTVVTVNGAEQVCDRRGCGYPKDQSSRVRFLTAEEQRRELMQRMGFKSYCEMHHRYDCDLNGPCYFGESQAQINGRDN